ncbi:hypothetical protein LMANV2_240020 [Leptospira interrogans serovar Manilae]|uniref:Uncharacterized protein n=1 Tax=Leptospira interrogans serovar Manilae TaxID=214675 RepID=A0AAQ1SN03_LEPIR|nr:hypothetical protein LMANV2_240020 [Leptospira interrogans serovar Manilae]
MKRFLVYKQNLLVIFAKLSSINFNYKYCFKTKCWIVLYSSG